jgi:hypothetical protein
MGVLRMFKRRLSWRLLRCGPQNIISGIDERIARLTHARDLVKPSGTPADGSNVEARLGRPKKDRCGAGQSTRRSTARAEPEPYVRPPVARGVDRHR